MKKYFSLALALVMLVSSLSIGIVADARDDKNVANANVTFEQKSYYYSGSKIEPEVTVALGDVILVKDTDYTVSYSNNLNAGTATAKISGKGDYTGEITKNFKIVPIRIANSNAEFIRIKKATPGSAPVYTVKYNGKTLKEGTDYNVVVSGIDKAGVKTGTVQFQGIGNFNNVKTLKINVFPTSVKKVGVKSRTTNSITLKWSSLESEGVDGYKVYFCNQNGENKKYIKTTDTNSATVKKLDAGKYYTFTVVPFVKDGSTKVHGEDSAPFLTVSRPNKVTINSVGKAKKGSKITVKWNKTSCTAYEIQYTTDKNFKKNVKTVVVEGSKHTSKTIAVPNNKKVYYARVRAYRQFNHGNTKVCGKWSSKLSTNYGNLYAMYVCHYPDKPARNNNLRVACKAINGTVIYPGEVFSFNGVVGKRTTAKGYKAAPIYQGPNVVTDGIGGGVCQVASTVFNTALLANFEIVERHQHSQRVHYGKLGRDATVYWGSQDFKFRNSSEYPIKIKMYLGNQCVRCYFYTSYDVKPRKVKLTVTQNGKHFKLTRSVAGKVNYTTHSYY